MLDCVDTGFISDGMLDELPMPSQICANPHWRHRPGQAPQPGMRRKSQREQRWGKHGALCQNPHPDRIRSARRRPCVQARLQGHRHPAGLPAG
jgi:hypothetical protein